MYRYCFCSNSYGYYSSVPSLCDYHCLGNTSQLCGGHDIPSNSIYYTYSKFFFNWRKLFFRTKKNDYIILAGCKSHKFRRINKSTVNVTSFKEIRLVGSYSASKMGCIKHCFTDKKCDLLVLIKNECYLFNGFIGFVDYSLEDYFRNRSSIFYHKKCFY